MMSVLRRVAVAAPQALTPHWKDIIPSICAVVQVLFDALHCAVLYCALHGPSVLAPAALALPCLSTFSACMATDRLGLPSAAGSRFKL
jgi:hypothetical protein